MDLRRQPSRCIGQYQINIARPPCIDRIENYRRSIARLLGDYPDAVALAPHFELFARSRAKSVAGSEQYRFAGLLIIMRDFSNRGCFAGTVDAGYHYDKRPLRGDIERYRSRLQQFKQDVA